MKKFNLIICLIFFIGISSAAEFNNPVSNSFNYNANPQFTNPSFDNFYSNEDIGTYWPGLKEKMDSEQCSEGTDFLMMIPPGGCSPAVVRSDLLEEQNVPVFCKIQVAQVNPLIKVSSIKHMSFKGKYPAEIAGVSYHPSRAALRSYNTLLGSPVVNNAGYVVLVLKKQKNESSMKDWVGGNLTATISYDADKAFGTGQAEYYLESMDDEEWSANWGDNSFWQGRGYLRLVDVQGGRATVELLTSENNVFSRVTLKEGETSGRINFPGSYCGASLKVKLNSVVSDEDKALLNIDGENVWVRRGSKILNGKCTVSSLELFGPQTGKVKLSCGGKPIELSLLSSQRANLILNGGERKTYDINDFVIDSTLSGEAANDRNLEYSWYVGHVGKMKQRLGSNPPIEKETPYIILLASEKGKSPSSKSYIELATKIKNTFDKNIPETRDAFVRAITPRGFEDKIVVLFMDEDGFKNKLTFTDLYDPNLEAQAAKPAQPPTSQLTDEQKEIIKTYFEGADQAVKELMENYPASIESTLTYSEQGILEEIKLIDDLAAVKIDYQYRKVELLNKFLEMYPESSQRFYVETLLANSEIFDTTNAYSTVYVNNQHHSISVAQFRESDKSAKKVELYVDQKYQGAKQEDDEILLDEKIKDALKIKKINPRNIEVDFYYYDTSKQDSKPAIKSLTIPFRETQNGDLEIFEIIKDKDKKYTVQISDIDVKEVAYVSLVPEVKTRSEANLTYKIGIEKREFPLSPEKAKEKADELNETIKKWEERNKQLGELVEKWKGVCLATGATLQVKSLFSGFTGKSLARQEVMETYRNYCGSNATNSEGERYSGKSRDVCYNDLSSDINSDVEIYTKAIQHVNSRVEGIENVELWKAQNNPSTVIALPENKNIIIENLQTWEEVRAYLLRDYIKNSEASERLKADTDAKTLNTLMSVYERVEDSKGVVSLQSSLPSKYSSSAVSLEDKRKTDLVLNNYQTISVGELKSDIENLDSNTELRAYLDSQDYSKKIGVAITSSGTDNKLIIVDNIGASSSPNLVGVYNLLKPTNPAKLSIGTSDNSFRDKISVSNIAGRKCAYSFSNPIAKFYDTEPNKGMASIVPFDLKEGWYVYVTQSQGSILSNNVQGYQESGAVKFYYICNVGSNGREERKGGDDICQSFNSNNYEDVEAFSACSLSKSQVTSLIRRAESALKEAATQYKKGAREIVIAGQKMPAQPTDGNSDDLYECQDFMSPEECKLMYNVCDPVICPSSRCDFGGEYPVSNVVSSGIVGSLVLCSKNFVGFGGDVYVPVCLTGLHAGIDGFISILKAQQSCMQEYVKSGKHTGICDEMTAVYKCEFFWRQTAPLLQNVIPNVAESIYTGGEKGFGKNSGGGEYLTFQGAWDNMQKGIDYFKSTYAQTSFRAASFGNVEEIGVEYCRNFIGTSVPTSGKALDALLKPESPPQFYAQFSEIKLTEATVPVTSQYKVFYHIFAGKEQGASYSVYLKNPPSSSYYINAQTRVVKTGYVQVGQQVSESVDFSAPEGYKELCVVINNQEECGFKSVTSDFGLNYLHDSYAKDQAKETDIKTEKECIAGSPSVLAAVNLNPQAGLEEAANPDISLRGIVRVCSTENPGKGVSEFNWKQVGYCNDEKMICWLDSSSVDKDALNIVQKTNTLAEAKQVIEDKVNTGQDVWTEEETRNKLQEIKDGTKKLNVDEKNSDSIVEGVAPLLKISEELEVKAYLDSHKAENFLLRFRLYEHVVRKLAKLNVEVSTPAIAPAPVADSNNNANSVPEQVPENLDFKITQVFIEVEDNLGEQVSSLTITNNGVLSSVPFEQSLSISMSHSCNSVRLKQDRTVLGILPWFSKNVEYKNNEFSLGVLKQNEKKSYTLECLDSTEKIRSNFRVNLIADQNSLPSAELA